MQRLVADGGRPVETGQGHQSQPGDLVVVQRAGAAGHHAGRQFPDNSLYQPLGVTEGLGPVFTGAVEAEQQPVA